MSRHKLHRRAVKKKSQKVYNGKEKAHRNDSDGSFAYEEETEEMIDFSEWSEVNGKEILYCLRQ